MTQAAMVVQKAPLWTAIDKPAVVLSLFLPFSSGFFFENNLEEMAAPKSPIAGANPFPLRHRTAFALSAADPVYIFDLAQVSNLAILNPNRYSTHHFNNI